MFSETIISLTSVQIGNKRLLRFQTYCETPADPGLYTDCPHLQPSCHCRRGCTTPQHRRPPLSPPSFYLPHMGTKGNFSPFKGRKMFEASSSCVTRLALNSWGFSCLTSQVPIPNCQGVCQQKSNISGVEWRGVWSSAVWITSL